MWHLLKGFVHEELPELRIMLRAAPPLLKKRDEGSQSQRGEGKRDVGLVQKQHWSNKQINI